MEVGGLQFAGYSLQDTAKQCRPATHQLVFVLVMQQS
jgi:hypothetical protein